MIPIKKMEWVVMASMAFLVSVIISDKIKMDKKKAKTEQRTKDFAKYIFDDVNAIVEKYATEKEVKEFQKFAKRYKKSPEYYNEVIERWMADSTKYADAIVRDADIIHKFDKSVGKTISFEEAVKKIESAKGPATKYNHSHQGHHMQLINEPKVMKINKKHLIDASAQLAIIRKAKKASEK